MMAESEPKSETWRSLDTIRLLITVPTTVVVFYFIWQIHWILAVYMAITVYILLLNLVGFLTSRLYSLISSDAKAVSEMWKRVDNGDTDLLHPISDNMVDEANEDATTTPAPEEQTVSCGS